MQSMLIDRRRFNTGLAASSAWLAMPHHAMATTAPYPFGSGAVSGPLHFGPGQPVNVVGKYFNAGGITVSGGANVVIQNCDFADGFGVSMDNCSGSVKVLSNRFRNPATNAMLVTNSNLHGIISKNAVRGHSSSTVDYFRFSNVWGVDNTDAGLLKVQFNHVDGRDVSTGMTNILPNGGSAFFYGGMTTAGLGNVSLISNTMFNSSQYGIHVDSGASIVLYYNGCYCEKFPNSIAAIYLSKGTGTVGGDVQVNVHDLYWVNAAGAQSPYLDDRTLATSYLSNVMLSVNLNAVG